MRSRLGIAPVLGVVTILGCNSLDPAHPNPPDEERLVLKVIEGTDGQEQVAGQPLPRPLQVLVTRGGVAQADVPVRWSVDNGTLNVYSTFTDRFGIASTKWTLGGGEGPAVARVAPYDDADNYAEFHATRWPMVAASLTSPNSPLQGEVGTAYPVPITVVVRKGQNTPAVGIPVTWSVSSGFLTSLSRETNAEGHATAVWTLGTKAGEQSLSVTVRGSHAPVVLKISARAGAPALMTIDRTPAPRPANFQFFEDRVWVSVTDQYANRIEDLPVAWSVEGPVAIGVSTSRTNSDGQAYAGIRSIGIPGTATVRLTAVNHPISVAIPVLLTAPEYAIHLTSSGFISPANGTSPAVDTVPVGATVRWVLMPFDYDDHEIESVSGPPFVGGPFPYSSLSTVSATLTTPGTYQYRDRWYGWTGTIVVK